MPAEQRISEKKISRAKKINIKNSILWTTSNLRKKYSFTYPFTRLFIHAWYQDNGFRNHITKKEAKRFWLRDVNFIFKFSVLRCKKFEFYSVFLLTINMKHKKNIPIKL